MTTNAIFMHALPPPLPLPGCAAEKVRPPPSASIFLGVGRGQGGNTARNPTLRASPGEHGHCARPDSPLPKGVLPCSPPEAIFHDPLVMGTIRKSEAHLGRPCR